MARGQERPRGGAGERPPTERRRRAMARREQILDAAVGLFAERGFAATTTKEIARAAGVADGLVFHYFPDKASILKAIAERRSAFAGEALAILEGAEWRPAREVLGEIGEAFVGTLYGERDLAATMLAEGQTDPELGAGLGEFLGRVVERLAGYLASRARRGELREYVPAEVGAQMFLSSLLVFFVTHRHLPETEWRGRASAHVGALIEAWFAGVGSAAGAAVPSSAPPGEKPA